MSQIVTSSEGHDFPAPGQRHIDHDLITHDVLTKVSTELFDRVAG